MDPAIWSKLPQEILEMHVLALLDYETLPVMRCVCKRWTGLFSSCHQFTPRCGSCHRHRSQKKPFLMTTDGEEGICRAFNMCNPVTGEWRRFSLSFLAPVFESRSFVASGGGLLCLRGIVAQKDDTISSTGGSEPVSDVKFLLCNPLTKSWRLLPDPPCGTDWDYSVKVLAFDETSNSFKIVLANVVVDVSECFNSKTEISIECDERREKQLLAQIYDSDTDAWTTVSDTIYDESICQGVAVGGSIHFKAYSTFHTWNQPRPRLVMEGVSMDLQTKSFAKFPLPAAFDITMLFEGFPSESVDEMTVMDFQGCLSIADPVNARVLKMNEKGAWTRAMKLPFKQNKDWRKMCLGNGDFLFFPCKENFGLICYNASKKSWIRVDGANIRESKKGWVWQNFSLFHPSLHQV